MCRPYKSPPERRLGTQNPTSEAIPCHQTPTNPPNSGQTIELVKHTNDETTTIATFTGESRTTWFAAQVNDDEAVYGWVGADKTATDMFPTWTAADNRIPIEPTLCQIGRDSYSIIVATDDVMLKTESEQNRLKMPRTGGLTGHISMLEEPTSNQR